MDLFVEEAEKVEGSPAADGAENEKLDTSSSHQGLTDCFSASFDTRSLFPQPTGDAYDPLNFSKARKWTCLGIVMAMYFMFTFITTTTVPSFAMLQEQYNVGFMPVTWTIAVPCLGLGLGPLLWSPLADTYGRRIIMVVGTLMAFLATIWSALAETFPSYMASRFFQGLGVSPASTVGMAIINDLFFEHERGQKVGLWVLAIDLGLLVGPLVGGFVVLADHYWVAWLCAIIFGVILLVEIFFLPETLYPRNRMLSAASASAGHGETAGFSYDDIPRTKGLGFFNFRVVPGITPPKIWDATVQTFKLFTFPNVSIAVFFYCFAWYWWIISVITYIPIAYKTYKLEMQGLMYGGLIIGTLVSELLFSGTLSDMIMNRFARRNNGVRIPEKRLWLNYPAILLTGVGLIIWGISVSKCLHWFVGQFALTLLGAGIQMGNTICSSYIVDNYPLHTMSVITFYAVLINFSAFINPFFIPHWVDPHGFASAFGIQGGIVLGVMIPVTIFLQKYGERLRKKRGFPSWTSPEYAAAS